MIIEKRHEVSFGHRILTTSFFICNSKSQIEPTLVKEGDIAGETDSRVLQRRDITVEYPDMEDERVMKTGDNRRRGVEDEVRLMKTDEPPVRENGIPLACNCGASVILATSYEPLRRGHRYFTCGYTLSDGRGHGCGFKKWLESSILEEFKEIKQDKDEIAQFVEELNVKIDDLQLKFQEVAEEKNDTHMVELVGEAHMKIEEMELKYETLESQYLEMEAKYEMMQNDLKRLKKYL